jgi:membrane-associated phospholipid phosphatase
MDQTKSKSSLLILPKFATHQSKFKIIIPFAALAGLGYYLTNHFHFFEPVELSFFAFEHHIPLMPWSIWPYLTMYSFTAFLLITLRDEENLNRMGMALIATQLIAFIVFTLYPTTYPRPSVIDLSGADYFSRNMFLSLWNADNPANCCPSLHVANSILAAMGFWYEQRKKFVPYMVWALIICFTTLTTKQHYFWDVIWGIILALLTTFLFQSRRFLSFKN